MKPLLAALLCVPLAFFALKGQAASLDSIKFTGIPIPPLKKDSPTTHKDLKGKILVIDFWASWCGPCKSAIPHYNKLYQEFKKQDVLFIGINEDDDLKERDAFLQSMTIDFPLYQDRGQSFASAFNVQALPSLFILDRNHKVVAQFRGFDESKPAALKKLLRELIDKNQADKK